jgi:hypothetical protein
MRGLLTVGFTSILIVAVAFAGEMTAEQVMQKLMTCPSCRPYMEYPQLGPNMRFDTNRISNGFIASQMVASEKMVPMLRECEKKCEVTYAAAAELSPEEAEAQLCPFCLGIYKLMARGDVEQEKVETSLGHIMLATSDTEDGVKALHAYVDMAQETHKLIEEMAAKMKPKE